MTPERVRELLVYDYQTGMFTWRVTRGEFIAGAVAGSLKREGYWRIGLDGKQYAAHRLAWAYVYGVWPKHGLDHRDRDKTNNRVDNLREATNAQNAQNAAPPPKEGGLLGVTKLRNKWQAQINAGGKYHYLGVFATKEAAHGAYLEAKSRMHEFQPTP